MKTKYAFQGMKENMARALSKDLGISTKVSIEIANFLRGKTSEEAKTILGRVLKKKQPIPFKRFTDGVGHRKGTGLAAGRFPEKATEAFITIIKQCEANAQAKGLSNNLRIVHLVAHKGTNMFRHGRQRRRKYKRTHLEIALEEFEPKDKEPVKKSVKKESKVESKQAKPKPAENQPVKKEKEDDVKIKKEEKTPVDAGSDDSKKQSSEEQK